MKERKKYGQKGARKRFQFTKRYRIGRGNSPLQRALAVPCKRRRQDHGRQAAGKRLLRGK